MPKVPPGYPVLLGHLGHVTTDLVVRSCLGLGAGNYQQNLIVFRRLGDLIPLVRRNDSGIGSGLVGQVVLVHAHNIPCALGLVLQRPPG